MKLRGLFIGAVCLMVAIMVVADGIYKTASTDLTANVGTDTTTVDSAHTVLFYLITQNTSAADSHTYTCSLYCYKEGAATYYDSTDVTWTSPVEKFTFTYDTTDWYYDSVACSLIFVFDAGAAPADTLKATWTSPSYTLKITPTDSNQYQYVDTFILGASDTFVATYTSDASATVAEITSNMTDSINATATLTDSLLAIDGTTHYLVKSAWSTRSLGYEMDWTTIVDAKQDTVTDTARATLAMFCDSLAKACSTTTNLKDSIYVEDSATYIKIISSFGEATYGDKRWILKTYTDSMGDTASQLTDSAMVYDSFTVYVNASACTSCVTAAVTGDTGVTITADYNQMFVTAYVAADSLDTTLVTGIDTVTAGQSRCSTLVVLSSTAHKFNAHNWFIKVPASARTSHGLGNVDTAWVRTIAYFGDSTISLSNDSGTVPLAVNVTWIDTTAGTSLPQVVAAWIIVGDTVSDTTFEGTYRLTYTTIEKEIAK